MSGDVNAAADTIRDIFWQPLRIADHDKANAALDALLAELQEKKLELAVAYGGPEQRREQDEWFSALDRCKEQRQQAIDALRQARLSSRDPQVHKIIDAALVKLGEQP